VTLTELKYVVAVARKRHFGLAAQTCFVSQPTLSVAVKKLEDELGGALFERHPNEILLTSLGERVVEQAQRVLEEADRIRQIAENERYALDVPLRVGVIFTIGPYLLPKFVTAVREEAPNLSLILTENYTAKLAEMLRSGELDVAILSLPFGGPGLMVQPVYDEPFVVAIPSGHPWEGRKEINPDDLKNENVLLLGFGHCFRDQVLQLCPALGRSAAADTLQKTFEGSSLETIRHMVATGVGITVLPSMAAGDWMFDNHLLTYRAFADPMPDRRVVLVWRKSFPRPMAIEAIRRAIFASDLPGVRLLPDEPARLSSVTTFYGAECG
jgi:LysR family hydrogen peroxide-inducible transcriptional activator